MFAVVATLTGAFADTAADRPSTLYVLAYGRSCLYPRHSGIDELFHVELRHSQLTVDVT